MNADPQEERTTQSEQSRLVSINTVLCGIGAVLYLIDCVLVSKLELKAIYVWLPLLCALSLVAAVSAVFTLLGIAVAFRNSFLTAEPQRPFTQLQRFCTRSCVSIIPLSALIVFVTIVGGLFK